MTTTAIPTPSTTTTTRTKRRTRTGVPTWRSGLAAGAVAAAATSAVVVALRAADVPPQVGGESIPLLGFVQMVLLGTVIGIVLARRVRRTTFVRATVVLTALSCVPSLALGTGVGSKLGLVLTHVVAAAVVVPALARRVES
jgi:peptidoglycan/LPS O-acetylase OafA/YrhL